MKRTIIGQRTFLMTSEVRIKKVKYSQQSLWYSYDISCRVVLTTRNVSAMEKQVVKELHSFTSSFNFLLVITIP